MFYIRIGDDLSILLTHFDCAFLPLVLLAISILPLDRKQQCQLRFSYFASVCFDNL